jgi:hypothetical protein
MPTFLYHVLQHAVEEHIRCHSLKRLVLGGEKAAEGSVANFAILQQSLAHLTSMW